MAIPTKEAGKRSPYSGQPCAQLNMVCFINEEEGENGYLEMTVDLYYTILPKLPVDLE